MANTQGTSVISTPSGGGAQSGMGEKFSPDLFTGTGNFSVPIAVPPGRNGFQPELTLGYSSGNGNGIFGLGWALGIPGVTRKTAKGIPVYDNRADIFILSGAEDLVPVTIESEIISTISGNVGWERTYYRPRTEGLFARIIRHKKTNGEHYWEVRSKDGLISWYGTEGEPNDPCVTADPEDRTAIFSWHLSKTQDPFGNVILYEYTRDLVIAAPTSNTSVNAGRSYDQLYPSKIKYAQYLSGTVTKYLCEVDFVYEDRPDPFSAYKQGFETRIVKRCTKIETYTNAVSLIKTKTYHFNYVATLPLNGASMLASVSVEGHNGSESEFMPPLEFGYSPFDPSKRQLQEITGPLPSVFLSDPGYELVDITGNGLPDLLQLNGTARYWTNKGYGQFSAPRNLNISPGVQLGMPGVQMIDANGDGRSDLMVTDGKKAGYYPGAFRSVWDSNNFRSYQQTPSFSFSDPEVQLIDLDGDGVTDVLKNGTKFQCFYNHPQKGFYKTRTADKKFADISFSDPRVRFADMTGDGLQDIVLISSGRVQYWPNLGYGRFGNKISMKNAPRFPEQYNPSQVLLGDLDGDGQADIAFVENNSVTLYINQSGNAFSAPTKVVNTPMVRDIKAIRIVDMMGTGQAGILWTFAGGLSAPGKMFFLDFTHGNKPYVLEEMNNNMGSLTRVSYGSSVYHYLRDEKQKLTKWKTDLPFPTQVINRVEVLDLLSGGKLVTEYKYHNGYWDGAEREFRGFAHVDATDTESFEQFNIQNLFDDQQNVNTVSAEHYSPPTETRSWFYVGPVGDGFSRWQEPDFSTEYWSGDAPVLTRPDDMKALLSSLPRRARRDALRTLRGSMLRSELYALDGSTLQDRPYTVTESMMSLRMEFDPSQLPNPLWGETSGYASGGGYIFFSFNTGQRTTQYERGDDPMHNYSFTKDYDAYGQAQGQLSVGVPRGPKYRTASDVTDYLATYSITEYIYKDVHLGQYMVNRAKRSIGYDATKSSVNRSVFDLRDLVFLNSANYPVLSCVINYYDNLTIPFSGRPYGIIDLQGALVRSESLIITNSMINDIYGSSNIPPCFGSGSWSGHPTDFINSLQNVDGRLGYKNNTGSYYIDGWYAESRRLKYDISYGLILESKDVFNNRTTSDYDGYGFLPINNKQWLNNIDYLETTADYDYRILQPYQVKDVNGNYSSFDFSPLGLLRAKALIGKSNPLSPEGDWKSNTGSFYDRYEPSARMEYDFFAFKNSGDPVFVKTTSRELHYQQSASSNTIVKVEYSDGFGRLLQVRSQAEDLLFSSSPATGTFFGDSGLSSDQNAGNADAIAKQRVIGAMVNVVVSGWKIFNNKGKVVEQFEPFFDKGFDYLLQDCSGVKVKMFYDPLGRLVKTVNPDNSQQWVIFGTPNNLTFPPDPVTQIGGSGCLSTPWISYTYDSNDLAPLTNLTGSNVPISHHFTPKSAQADALGRTIKTIEYLDNSNYSITIDMCYVYDIRGNLIIVTDPYIRAVFINKYDLRTAKKDDNGKPQPLPPLYVRHIDKGEIRVIYDALGKPVQSDDAKGARTLKAFDTLQRPTLSWANNKTGESITLRSCMIYGETAMTPSDSNLNGRIYQNYDEAGFVESPEYDFKGNILTKKRKVVNSSILKSSLVSYTNFVMDWTGNISPTSAILDGTFYQTDSSFDALNRIIELQLPQDLASERKRIIPAYNSSGALLKVDLYSPTGSVTTNYVEHIAYNAKGQRILIAFGNNRMTRYAYAPLTFRLLRQRTEGYSKSTSGNIVTYAYTSGTNKQDDGFNYDLVGNIVNLFARVTDCGIGGTPDKLDRTFEYDSIYRLTSANGRESNTQNSTYLYNDAPTPSTPVPSNVQAYSRSYRYDKLGNIESIIQSGVNGFTRDYIYNTGSNTLQKIQDSAPSTLENYTYDSSGNTIVTNLNRHYSWNHDDQMICYKNQVGSSDPTVYTQYDYSGQSRISKIVRTGTSANPVYERTIYIDGVFEYVKLEGSSTYQKNYIYIMDDKSRVAEIRINPGIAFPSDISNDIIYILEDNIRSSVARLNSSGTIIDEEEFYPFGDSSLRTFTYKRYRYISKERDAESGLYYYGARYYAAWTCRFIGVDPLARKYAHITPYNYSDNNPINDYDIDGMQNKNTGETPNSAHTITVNPLGNEGIPTKTGTPSTNNKSKNTVSGSESGGSKNTVDGPETTTQDIYRTSLTGIADGLNKLSGGKLDDNVSDSAATAYHLFYEWVKGTGPDSRKFDENSVMGKQMLQSPEIKDAIDKTLFKAAYGDYSGAEFFRKLRDENPVAYAAGFPKEAMDNAARAFHGSFGGKITVTATPLEGGNDVLIQMTVRFTDQMTAVSGSRGPEQVGGYNKENPTAVYQHENPYGPNGQFRTIHVTYEMKLNVIIHTQQPNWSKGVAPTFQATPGFGR